MHGRGIGDPLNVWIGLIDNLGPAPGSRSRSRVESHGSPGPCRPQTCKVQQPQRQVQGKTGEPRLSKLAIDEAVFLKDLGQTDPAAFRSIEDRPLLKPGRREMVVETARRGTVSTERVPGSRMRSALKVDAPEKSSGRQDPVVRDDPGQRRRRGRLGKLGQEKGLKVCGQLGDGVWRESEPEPLSRAHRVFGFSKDEIGIGQREPAQDG